MRKGVREVLFLTLVFLLGTDAPAAPRDGHRGGAGTEERVGITVELAWTVSEGSEVAAADDANAVLLSLSEGQVTEALAWPLAPSPSDSTSPRSRPDGTWQLGTEAVGRVRARIEASLASEFIIRRGSDVVRVPVSAVLERPQQTPAQAPLSVQISRLPWDSIAINLGPGAEDGIVTPSAALPVSVRYNILWPDAQEVTVRTTAVLKPLGDGEPLWSSEQRESIPANQLDPAPRLLTVPAPTSEGTYVLEVSATWEPSGSRDGTRLGRLIRRRKVQAASSTASRRVTFSVVAPGDASVSKTASVSPRSGETSETEVDSIDLGRIRANRFNAWGRSATVSPGRSLWALPAEALADAQRWNREQNRLRSWISRPVAEAASLGPADENGLAWSAIGLRVAHPERPHLLELTIAGGDPAALGVALVDARGNGRRPRIMLDACASGPPVLKDGPPVRFSWLVWPDTTEPLLVLLNRNASGSVHVGKVRVVELASLPSGPPIRLPNTASTRSLGLRFTRAEVMDRFGGTNEAGLVDAHRLATNLAGYLTYCGASLVVLPEDLSNRSPRRFLQGQGIEDTTGPDLLDLILSVLRRQGLGAWLELDLGDGKALPDLPPPDSPEAIQRGLVRIDRQGLADGPYYHPLHPEVRRAMRRRIEEGLTRHGERGTVSGILVRLESGPTLLGSPDTGMDDETFARFVHESFGAETLHGIPGLENGDPGRFAARSKFLEGVGRMPWLTWRARALAGLYGELSEATRTASPGAVLALATPVLDGGDAGAEARRVDLAGLVPSQAWRNVGLDFQSWPSAPDGPIVLRGVEVSTEPLAHDLATSPDLDAKVETQPRRGLLLTMDSQWTAESLGVRAGHEAALEQPEQGPSVARPSFYPEGSDSPVLRTLPLGDDIAADESLGHALGALDAQWVIVTAATFAGHEDRLRRFAPVLRSLPTWAAQTLKTSADSRDFGITVRSLTDDSQTYFEIANDAPFPIRLAGILDMAESTNVEDLGRNLRLIPQPASGGRQLVLDLLPHGVAAIRVGAPRVSMSEIRPYPSGAVLTSMEARYHELSSQLARLNRGNTGGQGEPSNPGFEPPPTPTVRQTQNDAEPPVATGPGSALVGWSLDGPAGASIAIDTATPHSGQGCLKLSATAPASAVSDAFMPSNSSSLMIQAYFRGEPGGSRVRVWIQGEAGGQPYWRRSEFQVASGWEMKAVRARDLPAGGLDSARVRFELMTPGTLWIDDLQLSSEATPRAVRLNAQRTLLAALQAYRAQRYAEFARLASSHWTRYPGARSAGRWTQTAELSEATGAPRSGAEAASALPPDRRLR
jgi:hypothetical protein